MPSAAFGHYVMFPLLGNAQLAPVRLGMSRTLEAQARDCFLFAQMIHITWISGVSFLVGLGWSYRAFKRRESASFFLAVGFLLFAILSSVPK